MLFLQLQELEIENTSIRGDLSALQKSVADDNDLDGSGVKGGRAAKQLISLFKFFY